MMDEENKRIRAWFWLTNLPGYGYKKLAALRAAVDDVWELYEIEESVGREKAEEFLRQVFSLSDIKYSDAQIGAFFDRSLKRRLDKEFEGLAASDINMACIDSSDYPEKLRDIFDAPYILYYRGRLPEQNHKTVAIVGARACSEYGKHGKGYCRAACTVWSADCQRVCERDRYRIA